MFMELSGIQSDGHLVTEGKPYMVGVEESLTQHTSHFEPEHSFSSGPFPCAISELVLTSWSVGCGVVMVGGKVMQINTAEQQVK